MSILHEVRTSTAAARPARFRLLPLHAAFIFASFPTAIEESAIIFRHRAAPRHMPAHGPPHRDNRERSSNARAAGSVRRKGQRRSI